MENNNAPDFYDELMSEDGGDWLKRNFHHYTHSTSENSFDLFHEGKPYSKGLVKLEKSMKPAHKAAQIRNAVHRVTSAIATLNPAKTRNLDVSFASGVSYANSKQKVVIDVQPFSPENAHIFSGDDNKALDATLGFAVHEMLHLLQTETGFQHPPQGYTGTKGQQRQQAMVRHLFWNTVEDERIEKWGGDNVPGFMPYVAAAKRFSFEKYKAEKEQQQMAAAMQDPAMAEVLEFANTVYNFIRYPGALERDEVNKYEKELRELQKSMTPFPTTEREVNAIADKIYRMIEDKVLQMTEPPEQKGDGQGGDSDDQQQQGGGSGKDKQDKQDDKDGDGKDDKQQSGGGSGKQDKKDDGDEKQDGGGSGDDQKDDQQQDDKSKGGGKSNKPQKSDDDDEQGDGEDEDEKESGDGDENDGEDEQEGGDDQDGDDEQDGDGDEQDDDTQDDEDGQDGDDDDKDSDDEDGDGDESDDSENEKHDDGEDEGDDGDKSENKNNGGDPQQSGDAPVQPTTGNQDKPLTPEELEKRQEEIREKLAEFMQKALGAQDLSEQVKEQNDQKAANALRTSTSEVGRAERTSKEDLNPIDANPEDFGTRAHEFPQTDHLKSHHIPIEWIDKGKISDLNKARGIINYKSALSDVASYAAALRRKLERLNRNHRQTNYGLFEGELDETRLADTRARTPFKNFYKEEFDVKNPGAVIGLLLDESGSMNSEQEIARRIAVLFERATDKLNGIDLYVYGHTTGGYKPDEPSTMMFKYYEGRKTGDATKLGMISAHSNNRDGHAILETGLRMRRLLGNQKQKIIMFVVSDGEPSASVPQGFDGISYTKKCVEYLEKYQNMEIIHIAIRKGIPSHKMFKKFVAFTNFATLVRDMGGLLEKIVKEANTVK